MSTKQIVNKTNKKLNSYVAGAVNNKITYIYFADHVNQRCTVPFCSPAPLTQVPQIPAKQNEANNAMDMKKACYDGTNLKFSEWTVQLLTTPQR